MSSLDSSFCDDLENSARIDTDRLQVISSCFWIKGENQKGIFPTKFVEKCQA